MSNLSDLVRFTAVVNPKRTDDLKPEVLPHIGERRRFQVVWFIEGSDNNDYAGDWACWMLGEDNRLNDVGWLPSRDLDDIILDGDRYVLLSKVADLIAGAPGVDEGGQWSPSDYADWLVGRLTREGQ